MFLQNCLWVLRYLKISNFGYPVPKITENAQPYIHVCIFLMGQTESNYSQSDKHTRSAFKPIHY